MSEPPALRQPSLADVSIKDQTVKVGSESWEGAGAYEAGSEFEKRATAFFAFVKWDTLASLSSNIRHGIPCSFGEKYSIGHYNLVRRVVFADGISWVARIRLPPLESMFGYRDKLDSSEILKIEIASMKFLKHVSNIQTALDFR